MAALLGFVGVIAGVLTAGGVQLVVADLDRRRAARASARQVVMTLVEVQAAMNASLALGGWEPGSFDWEAPLEEWRVHRAAMAAALPSQDFLTVSGAFTALATIARMRRDHMDPTPPGVERWNFTAAEQVIDGFYPVVAAAISVLDAAGRTRRERHRYPPLGAIAQARPDAHGSGDALP